MTYIYECFELDDNNLRVNRNVYKFNSYTSFSRSLRKVMEDRDKLIVRLQYIGDDFYVENCK